MFPRQALVIAAASEALKRLQDSGFQAIPGPKLSRTEVGK